tara:strand:+ start:5211 stop:6224 length:1014 start_codon:yes stop_codon:yes gene_type:complete
MIQKRNLGKTGLEVSVLGFGSAPLGDIYEHLDDLTATNTVETAAELGVTFFDTAPVYGQGIAEHRVGTGLRRAKLKDCVLSSKIGRLLVPAPQGRTKTSRFIGGLEFDIVHDYSYDGVMKSFESSLMRLGLPKIDILLIHDADPWAHGPEEGPKKYREAMDGAHRALSELRSDGTIKGMGFGTNDPIYAAKFLRDGDFDCFLLAGRYSLLEQPALDEVLPLAIAKNVGVILGGVFNSGILATGVVKDPKYNYTPAPENILEKVRKIEAVCQSHSVSLPTAALHFCLGHPQVSSLAIGAVHPDEVKENVSAITENIPSSLWSDLKSEGLLDNSAPTPK